jgi:putative transcriptional regulator
METDSGTMTGEELGLEILRGLRDFKAGKFRVAFSLVKHVREKLGMTQEEFAQMLGVSARTLEGWEQGKTKPSGAAVSLIKIAVARPDVVREVLAV